jgi:NAD(P)-dependent dehydrogenase (short-subunit alcohol dehydrogenase family)
VNPAPHSLVVGGTRGIGRAFVRHLASAGGKVSVIGRREVTESFGSNVRYWQVDLLTEKKLARALAEIVRAQGKLDNLIGFQRFKGEGEQWAEEIATTLTATNQIIDALADRFNKPGSIVLISSAAANLVCGEQPAGYHVAKAGINQLARYYAATLGPLGIRVNTVSPGTVIKDENRGYYYRQRKKLAAFTRNIPLRRMGTAEEIAGVISFLCSPAAGFITGQNLLVDGGISLLSQETLLQKFSC